MKALIVYASKTGTTKDVAAALAQRMPMETQLYDCRSKMLFGNGEEAPVKAEPDIDCYSVVVLGTAMYMGSPMKEWKKFIAKHRTELPSKPLAFFTCGIGTQEEDGKYLDKALPEALKKPALVYRHMGGELRLENMSGFAKLAMKEYQKEHGNTTGIDYSALDDLVREIDALLGGTA